jgi:predicted acyl esterase
LVDRRRGDDDWVARQTATAFQPGHQVRLEISSSSFPFVARNLKAGLSNETTGEMRRATQTIWHDAEHPSFVELPVVPLTDAYWRQARSTSVVTCLVD